MSLTERFPTVAEQILGSDFHHDNTQQIFQVSRLPRAVENTAKNIENNFAATADMLMKTADKLQDRADDLRQKARWLMEQRGLAHDLRHAVSYEQAAMDEVKSLALVDVGMRQEETKCVHGISFSVRCSRCDPKLSDILHPEN